MSETSGASWNRAERAIFLVGLVGFSIAFLVGSAAALRDRHMLPWASLSHLNVVRELRQSGELDGAIAELAAEQRLNASDTRADMLLAALLAKTGRPGAFEALAQASDSSFDPRVHLEYARKAAQLGHFEVMEIAVRRADVFHPQSEDLWMTVGDIYERAARHDEAIAAYSKALEVDPGSSRARRALARLEAAESPAREPLR